MWHGTFSPGVTASVYEEQIEEHFGKLPQNAHRVVFQGDLNTGFSWVPENGCPTAVAREGKGALVQKVLQERGLKMVAPIVSQWSTPTTRPRQEGRRGHIMDMLAVKHLRVFEHRIHVDSYLTLGTDHELVEGCVGLHAKKVYIRHDTRQREWTGGIQQVDFMDQAVQWLGGTQGSRGSRGFVDPEPVKVMFRRAKVPGVLRLGRPLSRLGLPPGNSGSMRDSSTPRRETGRHSGAEAAEAPGLGYGFRRESADDPHAAVHRHLQSVYEGPQVHVMPASSEVRPFEEAELRAALSSLKRRKAVGVDLSSTELLLGIAEVNGGFGHLLEWYNRILATQAIPVDGIGRSWRCYPRSPCLVSLEISGRSR